MLEPLRERNFALLWVGGLISLVGDWMLFIALPVAVYQMTGSTIATSGAFLAGFIPSFVLGSVAGVFVDRWDHKRTLVVTNLLLAAVLAPLLAVRSIDTLWIVYGVSFLSSAIEQFFKPGENALLPLLVDEEQLMAANSLTGLNNNLARLAGPSLGGLMFGLMGLAGVAVVDGISFLIAAALIARVDRPTRVRDKADQEEASLHPLKTLRREWTDGVTLILSERAIYGLFLIAGVVALAEGIFAVLVFPFVRHALSAGALQYGWLMSAQAVGGITGGLMTAWLSQRTKPVQLMAGGLVLLGLLHLVMWNVPILTVDLAIIAVAGLPVAASMAGYMTLLQERVEDDYRGRIFGALNTVMAPIIGSSMLLAGLLGSLIGIVSTLNISASLDVLAGLVGFALIGSIGAPKLAKVVSGDG